MLHNPCLVYDLGIIYVLLLWMMLVVLIMDPFILSYQMGTYLG